MNVCKANKYNWATIKSEIPAGADHNKQAIFVVWYACIAPQCDNTNDIKAIEVALKYYGLDSSLEII